MIKNVRFGRLVLVDDFGLRTKAKSILWRCVCDCGNIVNVRGADLRNGHTRSCGCLATENRSKQGKISGSYTSLRHGDTKNGAKTIEFMRWDAMIQRCVNTNDRNYHNYGGRGIRVCDRWLNSFENFLEDMGRCPDGMTLERIDNDGDYCPENCRWTTLHDQLRNKRTNVRVMINGESLIIEDAFELLPVSRSAFYRYKRRNNLTHQETIDHYLGGSI